MLQPSRAHCCNDDKESNAPSSKFLQPVIRSWLGQICHTKDLSFQCHFMIQYEESCERYGKTDTPCKLWSRTHFSSSCAQLFGNISCVQRCSHMPSLGLRPG
uniref:Uncharacterized protein n=1 Tax=Lessardia elongata TaxID=210733 RepID=A0A7S2QWC0_9DINO|mmetsp:Transcript_618/g.570  ORF Transcript_618/g.570 Transcript_618/m.570 type:complete len:102 (+) Transcript_618:44-349(+)